MRGGVGEAGRKEQGEKKCERGERAELNLII
jgi:hypothetical protein